MTYSPNKYPDRQTEQTLNSCIAKKLRIVPKWKGDLSNKEKFIKIGAFLQIYGKMKE